MFFLAAKTIGVLIVPSNVLVILCLTGALLNLTRHRKLGIGLMLATASLLFFCSFSPIGRAMLLPLEQRFPPWAKTDREPTGIVVLGGVIDGVISAERGVVELNASADRLTAVASLALNYPKARIVFSGGTGQLFPAGRAEAELAARFLESFGISKDRITLEQQSRDTAENAHYTRTLIKSQPGERWLLITSAAHMPRAVGSFRRAGFDFEAYPVDWRTGGWSDLQQLSFSASDGLAATDQATREWIGLIAYWVAGRTSELFPAPNKSR